MSVWALLLAAGSGERLGGERPKAFAKLGELPLLAESLRRLDASPWIDEIVVAAPPEWEEPSILLAEELAATKVAAVVTGGARRVDSTRAALAEVADDAVAVLVHDAARPLVTDEVIERVLGPLSEGADGVVPALPVADTVKRVEAGTVVQTLPRAELYAAQTPQAFPADVLRRALDPSNTLQLEDITDCASAVEASGGRVRVVEGDPRLLKITSKADLALVESWL